MTVYNFSDNLGGTITGFDVDADVLAIDAGVFGPAANATFNISGDDLTITTAAGAVTLAGVSILQITTTNVNFNDNSVILIGDDTTDPFGDAGANAGLADVGNTSSNIWGFGGGDTVNVTGDGANFVHGNAGADTINLNGDGNNIVRGGSEVDTITVNGDGHNNIMGDVGADVLLVNGDGNNTLSGGDDIDNIDIDGDGNNIVNGNAGDDDIDAGAGAAAGGDNFLRGGMGNDNIQVNAQATGDNTVWGDLGDDIITILGTGTNTAFGDSANKPGQGGSDTITIGATATGDNLVNGMFGNDTLVMDLLAAHVGEYTIRGGAGVDTFNITDTSAFGGELLLRGDNGADIFNLTLDFGAAQDDITIEGGAGADAYNLINMSAQAHELTFTDFDQTNDVLSITLAGGDSAADLTVNRAAGTTQIVGAAGETLNFTSSTVNFNATNFVMNDGSALITNFGGAAATLTSIAGEDDQLIAGSNGDTLVGSTGNDVLTGGSGADTFQFTGTLATTLSNHTLAGGSGTDTLVVITDAVTLADADWANVTGLETIDVNANVNGHNITVGANGNTAGIRTVDLAGVTTTTNTSTINTLAVTAATVVGGAGADTVTVGTGTNNVQLGTGADSLTLGNGAGSGTTAGTLQGGAGDDTLVGVDGTVTFDGTNLSSWENITLGNTAAVNVTFGAGYQASMEAATNLDITTSGSGAATTVNASAITADVTFVGDAVVDTVTTGSGDDTLTGGDGIDVLTGGTGSDTFRFVDDGHAGDEITDFTAGALAADGDVIALDTSAFGTGNLVDTNFVAGNEAAVQAASASNTIFVITGGAGYADYEGGAGNADFVLAGGTITDYLVVFYNTTTDMVEVWFDPDSDAAADSVQVAGLSNLDAIADLNDLVNANFDTF